MAEDKLFDLFENRPTFVKGEQPTGRKFTLWAEQTDQAFLDLEKAIGNMWGSFWIENDISPILMNTLARAIGSLDRINPLVPHNVDVNGYQQGTVAGQRYLWLDLFPNGTGGTWLTVSDDTAINTGQYQSSRTDLATDGDWTVVGRKIYTFAPCDGAGSQITYNGTTGDGTGGTPEGDLGTYFTVIPHLAQLNGTENTACTVTKQELAGETYYEVVLPYYLVDYNGDEPIVGTGVQLKLPPQALLTPGDEIPHGIIRLWDAGDPVNTELCQPISDSARYYAVNDTTFQIYNVVLEGFENQGVGYVVNTRYFVVTGGSSLAETLGKAWERMFTHSHTPYDFIPGVKHGDLDDLEPNGNDVDGSPLSWLLDYSTQSIIQNNAHPQYLYREGFQVDDDGSYFNMMLGDFVLSSITDNAPSDRYNNADFDSHKIRFGGNNGGYIYWAKALDVLNYRGIGGGSGHHFGITTSSGGEDDVKMWEALEVVGNATFDANVYVTDNFYIDAYYVDEISNDETLVDESTHALVTEYAIKTYVDTEVAKPLDIPTGTIILSESDGITGYTFLEDEDDYMVIITTTDTDLGTNNAGSWTASVADHSHRFHKDTKTCWDVDGNEITFQSQQTGKTTTGLIVNVWHADSTAAAGDRYTEPVSNVVETDWRPPARYFGRYQRT